ncbi:MAG: hypothetical protein JWM59_1532 [Verrucomicrobiales bacterium]|nr:hypothetical protein [Verrucomicrobiales bacterium]
MIPLRPYFSSHLLAAGVCAWTLLSTRPPGFAQDQSHGREPGRVQVPGMKESPASVPDGFLTETGALPACGGTPAITGELESESESPSCHAPQWVERIARAAAAADSNSKVPAAPEPKPSETPPPAAPVPTSVPPAPAPSTPAPVPTLPVDAIPPASVPASPKAGDPPTKTPAGTPVEPPRMFDGGVPPAAAGFQGTIKGCVETIGRKQSSFHMKIISATPDSEGRAAKPESLISAVVLVVQGMDRSPDNRWTPKPGHHEWITEVKPGDLVTVRIRYYKPLNCFRLIEVPPAPVPCDIPLPPKPAVSKPAPTPPASDPSALPPTAPAPVPAPPSQTPAPAQQAAK